MLSCATRDTVMPSMRAREGGSEGGEGREGGGGRGGTIASPRQVTNSSTIPGLCMKPHPISNCTTGNACPKPVEAPLADGRKAVNKAAMTPESTDCMRTGPVAKLVLLLATSLAVVHGCTKCGFQFQQTCSVVAATTSTGTVQDQSHHPYCMMVNDQAHKYTATKSDSKSLHTVRAFSSAASQSELCWRLFCLGALDLSSSLYCPTALSDAACVLPRKSEDATA